MAGYISCFSNLLQAETVTSDENQRLAFKIFSFFCSSEKKETSFWTKVSLAIKHFFTWINILSKFSLYLLRDKDNASLRNRGKLE